MGRGWISMTPTETSGPFPPRPPERPHGFERLAFGLLLALIIVMALGKCSVDRHVARAERADSVARSFEAQADRFRASTLMGLERLDSMRTAHVADSARWARERAVSRARIADAESRARAAEARSTVSQQAATEAGRTFAAGLDSTKAQEFAAIESKWVDALAEKDDQVGALTEVVDAQAGTIASLEEQLAALWPRTLTAEELVASLSDENVALRSANEALHDGNDARDAALRARGLENTLLKVGGGVLVALAAWDRVKSPS